MSSIESAPASIPATTAETFAPGFAPLSVGTLNRCSASSASPTDCASRSTGTSPAADTRFGSSNTADTAAGACLNCIYEIPLRSEEQNPTQVQSSPIREAFPCHDSRSEPVHIGGSRLSRLGSEEGCSDRRDLSSQAGTSQFLGRTARPAREKFVEHRQSATGIRTPRSQRSRLLDAVFSLFPDFVLSERDSNIAKGSESEKGP